MDVNSHEGTFCCECESGRWEVEGNGYGEGERWLCVDGVVGEDS